MDKNKLITDTFKWLFIGLLACFGVSYASSLSEEIIMTVYGSLGGYSYLVFVILELVLAVTFSVGIRKYSPTVAKLLYLAYSVLTGLSLTGIFIVYTESSIAFVFLATSLVVGLFAIIGKCTKIDLSNYGVYLLIALIAIIIIELINAFLLNNTLNIILAVVTIIVFCGYVAYDINQLLRNSYLDDTENKAVYYAFQLFLDFINIFLKLLRLFGKERD